MATMGEVALRAENVDKAIKNIVARKFVMKAQIPAVISSNSWEESFYRESITALGSVDDIPRGASFPADNVDFTKVKTRHQKFGLEGFVTYEDEHTDRVDVIARTLFRISNRIATGVDRHIWNIVTENQAPSNIYDITAGPGTGSHSFWNASARSARVPHEDIGKAITVIANSDLQAYMPDTICVNPLDYTYLVTNDYVLDSFDSSGPKVLQNGLMGTLMGLKIIVSPVVTTETAAVLQSKVCATYRQVETLRTVTKKDEGRGTIIRGWEVGHCQLTDPKAVALLRNLEE